MYVIKILSLPLKSKTSARYLSEHQRVWSSCIKRKRANVNASPLSPNPHQKRCRIDTTKVQLYFESANIFLFFFRATASKFIQGNKPDFYPSCRICNPAAISISILNAKRSRITNSDIQDCRIINPAGRRTEVIYSIRQNSAN